MRNVFAIIDELADRLAELKTLLQPLSAFASGTNSGSPRRRMQSRRQRPIPSRKARAGAPSRRPAAAPKPRKPVSPKLRAQRVQQGKYLAALRALTPQHRARVKKAKAEGNYASALKLAATLAKKPSQPRAAESKKLGKTNRSSEAIAQSA